MNTKYTSCTPVTDDRFVVNSFQESFAPVILTSPIFVPYLPSNLISTLPPLIGDAQIAIAKSCCQDKTRCNFNVIGIKCVDLLCVQDMIKEQIFPYIEENKE